MNVIPVEFNKLRRIIHLADIHVRLFKRHEEFRQCFEQLYVDLRATDLSNTAIVVAGDIVHSKTDLSPEMVGLISEFFTNLATLAPTLVIAGNHDLNVANQNRLDALSPIIDNIPHPNLHYLKYSGIYPLADVDFYVWSIIGEQVEWPQPVVNGRTSICLFHGPIHNAKTDIGYTVTNRHVMIETFDGFDMVLLGDIHRHQTLQAYDPDNKKPVMVYASSLIQQNHGENPEGHGWCDWDVALRTFKFRTLKNEYGYYTLRVVDGKVPDFSDMPKNVRLRIFAGNLDQADIKKLVTKIRLSHNVRELAISSFEGGKKTTSVPTLGTFLDIHDVHYQNKLISEYLENAMPNLASDVLERVLKLNKDKNEELSLEDAARKVIWNPISLEFDNLFTYGEGNSIDFTNLKSVVGIFAPNASGKTSIAEAICFALYDRTPRTVKAANIMNTRKNSCYLKFKFSVDGQEFTIERKGTRNKKGEVKIDVDFYRLDGETRISLNGEERRYTNENIRNYVGDFESFLLTTFSSSSQTGLFVDRGQSDRKDLLSQFMGLNIFDKLYNSASDESKEVKGALARFKNDDFTQELVDVQREIEQWEIQKFRYDEKLEEVNKELNAITLQIQQFFEQKVPIGNVVDIAVLESKEKVLRAQVAVIQDNLRISQEKRRDLSEKIQVAKDQLVANAFLADSYTRYEHVSNVVSKQTERVNNLERQLISARKEMDRLCQHKYDPECQYCLTNGAATIRRVGELTTEIETISNNLQTATKELKESSVEYDEMVNIPEEYRKYEQMSDWVVRAERDLALCDIAIEKLKSNVATTNSDISSTLSQIETVLNLQDSIKKNAEIDGHISILETSKKMKKGEFNTISSSIQNAVSRIAVYGQKKADMINRIKEAEELETKYEAYEAYLAAVHRDGLPYKLIAEIIPNLEVAVNNILSQMVDFTLIFDTDGKNVNIKIVYDDTRIWPLELASGMEKFISSLAIRVALTGISSLPKSNFLIVDEGLGTLDADNMSSISMLFDVLRIQFEFIMLISHVDAVRDIADSMVEIHRTDGFSRILVT